MVSYNHGLAVVSDSPFLLKSGWCWHGGEGGWPAVAVMLKLPDEALAVDHRPDVWIFAGDGHYACAAMVEEPAARNPD